MNAKKWGFGRNWLLLREQMDSGSMWVEIRLPGKGGGGWGRKGAGSQCGETYRPGQKFWIFLQAKTLGGWKTCFFPWVFKRPFGGLANAVGAPWHVPLPCMLAHLPYQQAVINTLSSCSLRRMTPRHILHSVSEGSSVGLNFCCPQWLLAWEWALHWLLSLPGISSPLSSWIFLVLSPKIGTCAQILISGFPSEQEEKEDYKMKQMY